MSYDLWLLSLSLCVGGLKTNFWTCPHLVTRGSVHATHTHTLTLLSKWRHTTDFCCLYQTNYNSRLTQRCERNFLHVSIQKTLCTLFINHLTTSPKGEFAIFSSCLRTILSPNYNKHTCGSSKMTHLTLQIPKRKPKHLFPTQFPHGSYQCQSSTNQSIPPVSWVNFALCDKAQTPQDNLMHVHTCIDTLKRCVLISWKQTHLLRVALALRGPQRKCPSEAVAGQNRLTGLLRDSTSPLNKLRTGTFAASFTSMHTSRSEQTHTHTHTRTQSSDTTRLNDWINHCSSEPTPETLR